MKPAWATAAFLSVKRLEAIHPTREIRKSWWKNRKLSLMNLKQLFNLGRTAVTTLIPKGAMVGPPCTPRPARSRAISSVRSVRTRDARLRANAGTPDPAWIAFKTLKSLLEIQRLTLSKGLVLAHDKDPKSARREAVPRTHLERRTKPWPWKSFSNRAALKLPRSKWFRAALRRQEARNRRQKRRKRLDYRCLRWLLITRPSSLWQM